VFATMVQLADACSSVSCSTGRGLITGDASAPGARRRNGDALDDVRAGFAEEGKKLLVRRLHP
jgi:hypothetical protein